MLQHFRFLNHDNGTTTILVHDTVVATMKTASVFGWLTTLDPVATL